MGQNLKVIKYKDNPRQTDTVFMKILGLSILMLMTTSIHATVSEAECTPTDIRDTNPRIKNNPAMREYFTTPRHQDSIGWCFGFIAADLISAETGTPVSTIHASLQYNKKIQSGAISRRQAERELSSGNFNEVYEGGDIADAINAVARNRAICPERLVPFDAQKPRATREFIDAIEKMRAANNGNLSQVCQEIDSYLPGFSQSNFDVQKISESLLQQNLNVSLEQMVQERCKNQMIPVPAYKVVSTRNNGRFNTINNLLNSGKPIGVTYLTRNFMNRPNGGGHASVLTGRRWRNGKCEYKIRNVWGKSCSEYKEGIPCDKEEGSFWITDAQFSTHIDDIQYIER